jgi:hypothetical protein
MVIEVARKERVRTSLHAGQIRDANHDRAIAKIELDHGVHKVFNPKIEGKEESRL